MQQRYLYVFISIGIALLGGVFLVWGKKIQKVPPQSQKLAEEVVETPKTERLDTSDWKTYRNEEYGIEFKYPTNKEGWSLNEEDYSKDSSLPYWPMKSVSVSYSPNKLKGYPNEELSFIFTPSRYSEGAVLPVGSEYVYIFDFHGQKAIGSLDDREKISAIFSGRSCEHNIYIELPDVKTTLKQKGPVAISISCRKNQATESVPYVFAAILDSARFFSNKSIK